jgi:hypothetical protein
MGIVALVDVGSLSSRIWCATVSSIKNESNRPRKTSFTLHIARIYGGSVSEERFRVMQLRKKEYC